MSEIRRWEVIGIEGMVSDGDGDYVLHVDHVAALEAVKWKAAAEYIKIDEAREALQAALDRQCDSMAFILNHMSIPVAYYEKFTRELEEDRAALAPPTIRVEGETQ